MQVLSAAADEADAARGEQQRLSDAHLASILRAQIRTALAELTASAPSVNDAAAPAVNNAAASDSAEGQLVRSQIRALEGRVLTLGAGSAADGEVERPGEAGGADVADGPVADDDGEQTDAEEEAEEEAKWVVGEEEADEDDLERDGSSGEAAALDCCGVCGEADDDRTSKEADAPWQPATVDGTDPSAMAAALVAAKRDAKARRHAPTHDAKTEGAVALQTVRAALATALAAVDAVDAVDAVEAVEAAAVAAPERDEQPTDVAGVAAGNAAADATGDAADDAAANERAAEAAAMQARMDALNEAIENAVADEDYEAADTLETELQALKERLATAVQ